VAQSGKMGLVDRLLKQLRPRGHKVRRDEAAAVSVPAGGASRQVLGVGTPPCVCVWGSCDVC